MGKLMSLDSAADYCRQLRERGRTVVFTNGVFDLLHVGHLDYLERARALGDALVVGLNSDASTRSLKGPAYPIVPQTERVRLLAALNVVDAVVVFDDATATALIQALEPHVYVKGGDYAGKPWPEKEAALALGCKVELVPFLAGHSTSDIVERVLVRFGRDGSAS